MYSPGIGSGGGVLIMDQRNSSCAPSGSLAIGEPDKSELMNRLIATALLLTLGVEISHSARNGS